MSGEVPVAVLLARAPLPPAVGIALVTSWIEAYTEQDLRPAQLKSLRAVLVRDRVMWLAGDAGPDDDIAEHALGRMLERLLYGGQGAVPQGPGAAEGAELARRLLASPPDLSGCRRYALEARRAAPLDLAGWLRATFPQTAATPDLEAWTGVYPAGRLAEMLQRAGGVPVIPDTPAPIEDLVSHVRDRATPVPVSTPVHAVERRSRPGSQVPWAWIALVVVLATMVVVLSLLLLLGSP